MTTQKGPPLARQTLKNPEIYSKTTLAVYKRRRFHMELMTGFDTYDLILTNGVFFQ